MQSCPDCGSEHLNAPCGMTWAQRVRTFRPATDWMPAKADSRQRGMTRPYFDSDPVNEVFGADSKERMLDETHGLGYAKPSPDGGFVHRDHRTGDVVPVSPEDMDRIFLGGDTEQDVELADA